MWTQVLCCVLMVIQIARLLTGPFDMDAVSILFLAQTILIGERNGKK